jgi:hypothetical protein
MLCKVIFIFSQINDIGCNILKKSRSYNLFIWNKACKKKSKVSTYVMLLVKLLKLTTKLEIFGDI